MTSTALGEIQDFVARTHWRVMPMVPVPTPTGVARIEKHLLLQGSLNANATNDPDIIRKWAEQWPWCLWGVLTCGFAVLDCDARWALDWAHVRAGCVPPQAPLVLTPRGHHLYLKPVRGLRSGPADGDLPIELKKGQQTVVLPIGDVARKLGYRWIRRPWEVSLGELPLRLRRLWRGPPPPVRNDLSVSVQAFSRGRGLRAQGADEDQILRVLRKEFDPETLDDDRIARLTYLVCKKPATKWVPKRRLKDGTYATLPGNGYQSPFVSNAHEFEIERTAPTPYVGRLATKLLAVLRALADRNQHIVRCSFPLLRAEVAKDAGWLRRIGRKGTRDALLHLNRLRLIQMPPARNRRVDGFLDHYFAVQVSPPLCAADRFLALTGGVPEKPVVPPGRPAQSA